MRKITHHKLPNSLNEMVDIHTSTDPDKDGINHKYDISLYHCNEWQKVSSIKFQEGSVKDGNVTVNGVTMEGLIAVVIDRLQCFQKGPLNSRENALAITKLEEAIHWLHHRTLERNQRGVEGSNQK
jgi:hypothetical protein